MSAARATAVRAALALLQAPATVAEVRARALPEEMTRLLRIVSGDDAMTLLATQETHEPAEALREAAEFFVQQVCFTPGIDSYRVLGVEALAATPRIREHYRLLVRWLHPDRNPDAWQSGFLDRVNQAWRDLRDAESRADYDQQRALQALGEAPTSPAAVAVSVGAPNWVAPASAARFSARTMRWLPGLVLALLGMVATLVLVLMYIDHVEDQRAALAMHPEPESAVPKPAKRPSPRRERPANSSILASSNVSPAASVTALPVSSPDPMEDASVVVPTATPLASDDADSAPDTGTSDALAAATPAVPVPVNASASLTSSASVPEPGQAIEVPNATAPDREAKVAVAVESASGPPESVFGNAASISLEQSLSPPDTNEGLESSFAEPMVSALLQRYRDAYDDGDLVRLMSLFTRDARNLPEGSQYLVDTYRQLFESSHSRRLSLKNMSWWQEGDAVAVVASFDAAIIPVGRERPRRIGGDIRFDLRREDGEVRIQRVRHQTQ